MKRKNKHKVTLTYGSIVVRTFVPKSRKLRKRLVGSGNCSVASCTRVLRNTFKGLLLAQNYGVGSTSMRNLVCN